jgi:hypothetical protein
MASSKSLQMLSCFYYKNVCSFIELCNIGEYSGDLGGYYIRQLIKDEYIEKIDRGQYQILSKGKHFLVANPQKITVSRQARVSIALVIKHGDQFVITRRTAQPFIDRIEWPTGSVKAGEVMSDAANRIALGRLGTTLPLHFLGFFRRTDTYENEVFDDKFLAVHTGILPSDNVLSKSNKVGENHLYTKDQLYTAESPSRSLIDILEYSQSNSGPYAERYYDLDASDLSIEEHWKSIDSFGV